MPRTSTKSTTSKPADVVDILAGAGPALALAVVTGSTEPHTWAASANQVVKSAADGYILGFNSGRAADGSGDVFAGVGIVDIYKWHAYQRHCGTPLFHALMTISLGKIGAREGKPPAST